MATKKSTKKAPTKKSAHKKVAAKKSTKLIGLQREHEEFMTFRISLQTIYWLILGAVVILFTMWILRLQVDVQRIYDEIDAQSAQMDVLPVPDKKKT